LSQFLFDELIDIFIGELDAELVGLFLPEHELDHITTFRGVDRGDKPPVNHHRELQIVRCLKGIEE
jgi:hypothetical protein